MTIQTAKRFTKTYVATLVLTVTSLLMGSSVIRTPVLYYIPYSHSVGHDSAIACSVAEAPTFLRRDAASDNADISLAIYRTVSYSDCSLEELLFI